MKRTILPALAMLPAGRVASVIPPVIGGVNISGGNLIFGGTGGTPDAVYYVLSATNVSLPPTQWTPVRTNQFDALGNFDFTNGIDFSQPQIFYRLRLP